MSDGVEVRRLAVVEGSLDTYGFTVQQAQNFSNMTQARLIACLNSNLFQKYFCGTVVFGGYEFKLGDFCLDASFQGIAAPQVIIVTALLKALGGKLGLGCPSTLLLHDNNLGALGGVVLADALKVQNY